MILIDVHGEATSEKIALAKHFDGKVSLVFGTHTHVQTADEEILPGGTARITDLGMCGPIDGILGMDADRSIARFRTGMPVSYALAPGRRGMRGIICDIDLESGKAIHIERVRREV